MVIDEAEGRRKTKKKIPVMTAIALCAMLATVYQSEHSVILLVSFSEYVVGDSTLRQKNTKKF